MVDNARRLDRLPLRDLLNHVEHRCRELTEHLQLDLVQSSKELHNLTRTTRRKSGYPSLRTVYHGCEKLHRAFAHAQDLTGEIEDCIAAIERRAARILMETDSG